jgi:probable rRNA maturation factor
MPTSDKPRHVPVATNRSPRHRQRTPAAASGGPRDLRAPAAARGGPRLDLSVQQAVAADGLPARSTLRRWIARALGPGAKSAAITLRFVGTTEGRRLNREFRNRDYATNVLTFVYDDAHAVPAGDAVSGDLVLCVPVLKREARAQKKSLRSHCAHLVIHGTLHLQGYDHESDKDATVMEALETRLLATLGYSDPYDEAR